MDAKVATDERDSSGRRSRVVLTPRCWRQVREKQNFSRMTVARKPGHRGERGVSRKPLRREGRIASAEPVCSCAFFCTLLHARPRVQRAPGFPCALLLLSRAAIDAKLGRIAPRDREAVSADTRCLKIESADIYRARMHHIPHAVIARLDRATQYSRAPMMKRNVAAHWIHRWSLSSGSPKARPGGGV